MAIEPADVRNMAERYTQAWCSGSASAVASFFTEGASSVVNDGKPVVGRDAIEQDMQAFFNDFPDLRLTMDDLRVGGHQAIFLWTLEGTNSGPGGTGNVVKIEGWQNWALSQDLLISNANGGFDAVEYERQIREGI